MDISKVDGEIEYRQKSKKERLKIKIEQDFFRLEYLIKFIQIKRNKIGRFAKKDHSNERCELYYCLQ